MNILYDKFPHRDVVLCTYSKLNSIKDGYAFINVKREGFTICISCSICPTIYVNKHISRLNYGRALAKESYPVVTQNRRIAAMDDFHIPLVLSLCDVNLGSTGVTLFIIYNITKFTGHCHAN